MNIHLAFLELKKFGRGLKQMVPYAWAAKID